MDNSHSDALAQLFQDLSEVPMDCSSALACGRRLPHATIPYEVPRRSHYRINLALRKAAESGVPFKEIECVYNLWLAHVPPSELAGRSSYDFHKVIWRGHAQVRNPRPTNGRAYGPPS